METSAAGSPIVSGPWKAWAQSSTRSRPRTLANFATTPSSMRPPNRCATRTTRVRGVSAAWSMQGSGASVSGSMSTGTARRPCSLMIRTMSGCVTAETRTSSPTRRPCAPSHRSHPLRAEKQTNPSSSKEHSRKTSPSNSSLLNCRPHERIPKHISSTEMSNLCRAYTPRHILTPSVLPNLPTHSNPQRLTPSLQPISYDVSLHCKTPWCHTQRVLEALRFQNPRRSASQHAAFEAACQHFSKYLPARLAHRAKLRGNRCRSYLIQRERPTQPLPNKADVLTSEGEA